MLIEYVQLALLVLVQVVNINLLLVLQVLIASVQAVLQTATNVTVLLFAKNAMPASLKPVEVVVKHVVPYRVYRINIITVLFALLTEYLDALLVPLVLVQTVTMNLLVAVSMLIEHAQLVPLLVLQELINQLHALHSQILNV
jgi:hypothetical protein